MPPEATLPIDAAGRLAIRSPGGVDLALEARGAVLRLEVRSWRDLVRLWRDAPRGAAPGGLNVALDASRLADLDCEVHLRRHAIARLGPRIRPTPLSRLLRVAPVRVEWRGLLASLVDRGG